MNLFHRFSEDLRNIPPWSTSLWSHTDLPRLKKGLVSAQVNIDQLYILDCQKVRPGEGSILHYILIRLCQIPVLLLS